MAKVETIYLIVQRYPMLEGQPTTILETELLPSPTTADVAASIVDENTVRVLAINEAAGTCINVTPAIAEIVVKLADKRGWISPDLRDWCEEHGATVWNTISVEAA